MGLGPVSDMLATLVPRKSKPSASASASSPSVSAAPTTSRDDRDKEREQKLVELITCTGQGRESCLSLLSQAVVCEDLHVHPLARACQG